MYTAAGLAAGAAAKSSWADVVYKRLLGPLGMSDTSLTTPAAEKTGRLAAGHRPAPGEAEVMPVYRLEEPEPAGSVHSTAADVGRWLRFHLSGGMADGKRVVSARALAETHRPQMVMDLPPLQQALFPDTVQMSYAMGWVVHDHQGVKLLSHGGAIAGYRAHVTLAPGKRLGVAVLANLDQTPMNMALTGTLIDQLLGLEKRDWHRLHRGVLTNRAAEQAEALRQRLARRRHDTKPSRELSAYAGTYEHPAYGEARITLQDGMLVWRWRDEAILDHFHHDTFRIRAELVGDAELTFTLDRAGRVEAVHVSGGLGITFSKRTDGRKRP
jgi:CubicO group peptidase (beta-lactamase class C family)